MARAPVLLGPQGAAPANGAKPSFDNKLLEKGPFPVRNDRYAAYQNIEAIGQGSSGIARKATDPEGNLVVIKELKTVLLPNMGEDAIKSAIDTFGKEAKILGRIYHPNIPECTDSFAREVEGEIKFYIVTKYVEGTSLRQYMKAGRFGEEQAKELLRQLLETAKYLQSFENPILHRDINPNNIILDKNGKYQLVDFGIAAIQSGGTVQGTECGTIGYAAPEQIALGKASTSSDVHGIGATVISMLTGKEPHDMGNDWQADFVKHTNISPEFAAILTKTVAPNKDNRYQSAAEVLRDLEGHGNAGVVQAPSTQSVLTHLDTLAGDCKKTQKEYERMQTERAKEIYSMVKKLTKMMKRGEITKHLSVENGGLRIELSTWTLRILGLKSYHSCAKDISIPWNFDFDFFNMKFSRTIAQNSIKDCLNEDENAYDAFMKLPLAARAQLAEKSNALAAQLGRLDRPSPIPARAEPKLLPARAQVQAEDDEKAGFYPIQVDAKAAGTGNKTG